MKVLYSGIGCKESGEHTIEEFLNIMSKEFTHKEWKEEILSIQQDYQLKFKDWVLPDDFVFFTLVDWIEYSGAALSE
jgi:hypothetical protein